MAKMIIMTSSQSDPHYGQIHNNKPNSHYPTHNIMRLIIMTCMLEGKIMISPTYMANNAIRSTTIVGEFLGHNTCSNSIAGKAEIAATCFFCLLFTSLLGVSLDLAVTTYKRGVREEALVWLPTHIHRCPQVNRETWWWLMFSLFFFLEIFYECHKKVFCVFVCRTFSVLLLYLLYVDEVIRRVHDTWNEVFWSMAIWRPFAGSPFHGWLSVSIWRVDMVQWFILFGQHGLMETCLCELVGSFLRTVFFHPFNYQAVKLLPREDLTCGKVHWLEPPSSDGAGALKGVVPLMPTSIVGKPSRSCCLTSPLLD